MNASLETERKYTTSDDAPIPPLEGVKGTAGVTGVEARGTATLEATYFDTADLRLLAARVTLRRRTGGTDAGWHLKLPAPGDARTEVHARAGRSDTPPAVLSRLVVGLARGERLRPVAQITTHRTLVVLTDEGGDVLAEVADDDVRAEALVGEPRAADWRELEVELKDGSVELLDAVEQLLSDAGVVRSKDRSKLGHVLGSVVAETPAVTKKSSAGAVAVDYLRGQVADLRAWDPEVRRDTEDSVHKARVATRRLRSALRTYSQLFEPEAVDPVKAELKWLAAELGAARDLEVMRDRLLAVVAEHPPELVMGPVAARLESELGGGYRGAHRHVVRAMSSKRYFALLDALDTLVTEPPFTPLAAKRADKVIPHLVHRTWRRVARLSAVANASGQDHDLHEVRKAAKRARYAGESLTSVFGEEADAYAAAMEDLQEVLGEHQDAVVTRDTLRDMGVRANLSGENGFTYGLLAGLEDARGETAREAYADALSEASEKSLRRWLRR